MLWIIGTFALLFLLFFTTYKDQRRNKGRGGLSSFVIACFVSSFTTAFFIVGGLIIYSMV